MWNKIKAVFKPKPMLKQYINLRTSSFDSIAVGISEEGYEEPEDLREKKEPISVIHELETNLKPIPLKDIKYQLKQMRIRKKYIEKLLKLVPENEDRAIEMLEARKKYPKYAHKFCWKTTVESKIVMLTTKYMLRHDEIGLFQKKIPDRAMTEITLFAQLYQKVSKGEPKFSLIAPDDNFKSEDPILLAKSPFGEYYYILCAWDKEISIVNELLDGENLVITK